MAITYNGSDFVSTRWRKQILMAEVVELIQGLFIEFMSNGKGCMFANLLPLNGDHVVEKSIVMQIS